MTKCTLLSGSKKLISNKQRLKCSRKPPTELFSTRRKFSRSVSSLVTMVSNFFVEFMSTITRSDVEVEKVVRTFLKGAYLKRCHKTIKGFSHDPTSTTLLKDIPYFGQHFGPHVEEWHWRHRRQVLPVKQRPSSWAWTAHTMAKKNLRKRWKIFDNI